MPNHITNILKIGGTEEQVSEVLEFIKCDKLGVGTIDFNKITPTPPWVSQSGYGRAQKEKYGEENCWYGWNIKHWGTKWNAYSQPSLRNTADTIHFETAWSNVSDLILKLSWIFPEVELYYRWADEDMGCNVGSLRVKDGEITGMVLPKNSSTEAYKMAFEITGREPEDYCMRYDEGLDAYISTEEDE